MCEANVIIDVTVKPMFDVKELVVINLYFVMFL